MLPQKGCWSTSFHLSATGAGTQTGQRRWDLGSQPSSIPPFVHGISNIFSVTNSSLHTLGWEMLCGQVGGIQHGRILPPSLFIENQALSAKIPIPISKKSREVTTSTPEFTKVLRSPGLPHLSFLSSLLPGVMKFP